MWEYSSVLSFSLRNRRISFGSMVACENPDCAIEWFHFECVGLKTEVTARTSFVSSCYNFFHLDCVIELTAQLVILPLYCASVQPADPWFCSTCREPPSKPSSSSSSSSSANVASGVTVAVKLPSDNDGSIS